MFSTGPSTCACVRAYTHGRADGTFSERFAVEFSSCTVVANYSHEAFIRLNSKLYTLDM